jgi:hypothetical protein
MDKPKGIIYANDLPDARTKGRPLEHYRNMLNQLVKEMTPEQKKVYTLNHYKQQAQLSAMQEDKYERMKGHIASAGVEKGLSGPALDRYVFGAMRARGWKPKRELKENLARDMFRGVKRTLKTDIQDVPRHMIQNVQKLSSPIQRYRRAMAYRERGRQALAHGRYDRGLSMIHRGNVVMQRHAPEALGTAVGLGAGAAFPLPGTMEVGTLAGRVGGRFVSRVMRARARKKK